MGGRVNVFCAYDAEIEAMKQDRNNILCTEEPIYSSAVQKAKYEAGLAAWDVSNQDHLKR